MEERDKQKKRACVDMGITLITVPYWWDGQLFSLATTVHTNRPDIEIPEAWLTSGIPPKRPKTPV